MRISYRSQVLEPSPQGVLRVVILRFLVGRRTGPLTARSLPLARSMSSEQTFSRDWTLREVRVMRILWVFCFSGAEMLALSQGNFVDVIAMRVVLRASWRAGKGDNAREPQSPHPSQASGKTS